jgi:hypothetical protein
MLTIPKLIAPFQSGRGMTSTSGKPTDAPGADQGTLL